MGVFAEFDISNKVSFSPRIKFSSQGFRDGVGSGIRNEVIITKESFNYDFLNIPLLLKFDVTEDFDFIVGPQIGFLLNNRAELFDTNLPVTILPQDRDDLPEGLKFDYGVKFGISYSIYQNLFLEVNYFYGFSNITKNDIAPNYENRNSVLQLNMGYLIF